MKMSPVPIREPRSGRETVRLLVADDHFVVREGLVSLLNLQPDLEVVSEAVDGEEAVDQAEALHPDAIVMDLEMPKIDGLEATRRIKSLRPSTVIIGLSLHDEESSARAMAEAGADAFVSKHMPAKNLVEAIRRACSERGDN